MFVPLPNAYGVLTAPLRQTGLVIAVDAALKVILDTLGDNYTYLALYNADRVEIVKVFAVDQYGVHIVRAQDNTEAYAFAQYDRVKYLATAAGIKDTIPEYNLTLTASGAIEINGYEVTYPELSIEVYGASQIVGDDASILIGRKENAYGCCDGDNTPAPIPAAPFYLTSQPYPTEVIEYITYTGDLLGGYTWTPPLEKITYTADILNGGTLRAVLQAYVIPKENITYTGDIGRPGAGGDDGGTLVQILRSIVQPFESITYTADIVPAGGTLTAILRQYTNWPLSPDEYLTYTASLLGGSLT